jgi:hypothetical protein
LKNLTLSAGVYKFVSSAQDFRDHLQRITKLATTRVEIIVRDNTAWGDVNLYAGDQGAALGRSKDGKSSAAGFSGDVLA